MSLTFAQKMFENIEVLLSYIIPQSPPPQKKNTW